MDDPSGGKFLSFLDQVTKAGDRSRRVTSIYILIVFFAACGIRTVYLPDWNGSRLDRDIATFECYEHPDSQQDQWFPLRDCATLVAMADRHYVPLDADGKLVPFDNNAPNVAFFKAYLTAEIGKSVMQNTLQIPFFNVALDQYDVWLIALVLMLMILVVLRETVNREYQNIAVAERRCPDNVCRDLLLMSQTFVPPERNRVSRRAGLWVMHFAAALVGTGVAILDMVPLHTAWDTITLLDLPAADVAQLVGWWETSIEYGLELVFLVAVWWASVRYHRIANAADALVAKIAASDYPKSGAA